MSITDELREWFKDRIFRGNGHAELTAIADRIDAEHQKALDEWKAEHGQMWLKGYSECHAELMEGNETLASDLERCGWVRLPLDADGVPIRIGDMMETPRGGVFTVTGIMCELGKWTVNGWIPASLRRHEPTVEDVLAEFANKVCNSGHQWGLDAADTIAEYAAKLCLKEDE